MDSVIFQRAKASDMLEGILDTIEILELEYQRLQRFWPEVSNVLYVETNLISGIQNLRNNTYMVRRVVSDWRMKGM